jgi:hypothetical protein
LEYSFALLSTGSPNAFKLLILLVKAVLLAFAPSPYKKFSYSSKRGANLAAISSGQYYLYSAYNADLHV